MPCLPSSTSPFFGGIPKPSPTLVVVAGFPYSLFILVTINRKKMFLVGGFNHLEKYIYMSMGRVIPYIMENKIHV
jgi:hypothetical protein